MVKIGDIFETNKSGQVEIIETLPKGIVRVKFKNTGQERTVSLHNLKNGNCRDLSISYRKLKGPKLENRFCVYLHKDSSGNVRYVGEGTIDRAYSKSRSDQPSWMAVFAEEPPIVEIVAKDLMKSEAEDLEIKIRNFYGDALINDKYATKKTKEIRFDLISQYVYYDETSPTFLRWINDMKNNAKAHSAAGHLPNIKDKKKYPCVEIEGEAYGIHRVVWVLHNKELSTQHMVDHIDGNKFNNSINNLRTTDAKVNSHNKVTKIPKSGYRNIGEDVYKDYVRSYMVRWIPLEHSDRQWKTFSVLEYGTAENALKAAYAFRDTLIEKGILPQRIKDGEIPISQDTDILTKEDNLVE